MRKIYIDFVLLVIFFVKFQNLANCAEPKIEFSHERGFYQESFKLTINSNVTGSIIKYTLDGSDPRYSAHTSSVISPAEINIDPYTSTGRAITPAVVVRACAIFNSDTSKVETHTYIFTAEVKFQHDVSPDLAPYWPVQSLVPSTYPPYAVDWMRSDVQLIDLGIDPEVIANKNYYADFEKALKDLPTLSLVTDPKNLFDDATGIYVNATWTGREWERPGSIEIIYPNGDDGIQANTGIRIRGAWSRLGTFPKHAFRLFFRKRIWNG